MFEGRFLHVQENARSIFVRAEHWKKRNLTRLDGLGIQVEGLEMSLLLFPEPET